MIRFDSIHLRPSGRGRDYAGHRIPKRGPTYYFLSIAEFAESDCRIFGEFLAENPIFVPVL